MICHLLSLQYLELVCHYRTFHSINKFYLSSFDWFNLTSLFSVSITYAKKIVKGGSYGIGWNEYVVGFFFFSIRTWNRSTNYLNWLTLLCLQSIYLYPKVAKLVAQSHRIDGLHQKLSSNMSSTTKEKWRSK